MSSNDDHNKGSKKRKKKYSSPFRIKIGCLVALRYRSRGNNVSILMPGRDSSPSSGSDGGGKDGFGSYQEEVASAQFSEVWTDPRWGRDSGLALIGSRIRCFFPKAVLSEPYNATSRLLEGTIVNVVRDQLSTESSSFGIDLLIDNKDNKTLSTTLPFLKRVDTDGQGDPAGKVWKESEQRRRQYEERIKGGRHKAVVRVSLSMSSFGRARPSGRNPLEAKWVIRKRVPIKIFRRKSQPVTTPEATAESVNDKGEEAKEKASGETDNTQVKETNGIDNADGEKVETISSQASQILPDSAINPKQQKRETNRTTAYNKDFSLPRYLGDGNDSTTQQEGNWRWEAGRYHNPFSSALSDRPISKSLLEKLSYNFVGEVISIHPTQSQQSKDLSIDTLAMVTIRLLLLPEHTHSGRQTHHGAFDLFECDDLDSNIGFFRGEQTTVAEDGDANNERERETRCFLRVPIEELVIVEKNVAREPFDPNKKQKTDHDRAEMMIRHSYSFFEDRYRRYQEPKQDPENLTENPAMQVCRRCRHLSLSNKRLAGIPQPLCQSCFDVLKASNAARLVNDKKSKSKTYDCDEFFCTEKNNSDLLVGLADEISGSESKLGSTLGELEDYTDGTDSGFIATRFILKGMNPVNFSIAPSSLSSFIGSASAKPVTKIKARISKGTKKANSGKDASRKNGNKSPVRNGSSSRDNGVVSRIVAKNEPFRSTSARLLPYDVPNRKFDVSASELYQWKIFRSSMSSFPEKPRNLRQHRKRENGGDSTSGNTEKKKLQGRAARAKQRRLLRGVSSLGVEVDILAGRETNVRFERSNIHGWGVFSDIDIRQGEMIIEYRGELIGNAMAEKREKEYEAAKIGSDYMFRIDEYTICDASKQGNVARFINASCSPNCYPKIIVLDGVKRVAVYAKRDIRAGEELCYDYKFDLEFDPAKRIPCICGSPDCRGFLNWDKRYVTVPNAAVPVANDEPKNKSNDKADSEKLAQAKP